MKRSPGIPAGVVLALVLATTACTQQNPTYIDAGGGGKDAAADGKVDGAALDSKLDLPDGSTAAEGIADLKKPLDIKSPLDTKEPLDTKTPPDVKAWPDVKPWPDLKPPPDQMQPDVVAWQCKVNKDCNDKLSCTTDICTAAKKCKNTLQAGWCNVNNACYKKGAGNPTNSCQWCDTTKSTTGWSNKSDGTTCKDDGIFCTYDRCKSGSCAHTIQANWCLISGTCHIKGKWNPTNNCQECATATSQTAWSNRKDGTACKGDGLWCTSDKCSAGTCKHILNTGCLINKICYPEGHIKTGDSCQECVGKNTRTAYTFVSGKPCFTSSNLAGMCMSSTCMGWKETLFKPSGNLTTDLYAAEYVPKSAKMWAAGRSYGAGSYKGVLVQIDSTSSTLPSLATSAPLTDMSHNMAVGTKGQHYRHNGGTWKKLTVTGGPPSGTDRLSVWGGTSGSVEGYVVGGKHTSTSSGIYGCVAGASSLSCTAQKGFGLNEVIGALRGVQSSGGVTSTVWGAVINSAGKEHIYFNKLTSSSWSRSGPTGCTDGGASGSTPCSQSTSTVVKMSGTDPKDIWLVGTKGLIMRYDGAKWAALTSVVNNQTTYDFDAVYASPAAKLATFAAHKDTAAGRTHVLFNYNSHLSRWLGPIIIKPPGNKNFKDVIKDIDGTGYANLWMVGSRVPTNVTPATKYTYAWILQLK